MARIDARNNNEQHTRHSEDVRGNVEGGRPRILGSGLWFSEPHTATTNTRRPPINLWYPHKEVTSMPPLWAESDSTQTQTQH
eukprot:869385-Pyramimonas_sp.AAC.1